MVPVTRERREDPGRRRQQPPLEHPVQAPRGLRLRHLGVGLCMEKRVEIGRLRFVEVEFCYFAEVLVF